MKAKVNAAWYPLIWRRFGDQEENLHLTLHTLDHSGNNIFQFRWLLFKKYGDKLAMR